MPPVIEDKLLIIVFCLPLSLKFDSTLLLLRLVSSIVGHAFISHVDPFLTLWFSLFFFLFLSTYVGRDEHSLFMFLTRIVCISKFNYSAIGDIRMVRKGKETIRVQIPVSGCIYLFALCTFLFVYSFTRQVFEQ